MHQNVNYDIVELWEIIQVVCAMYINTYKHIISSKLSTEEVDLGPMYVYDTSAVSKSMQVVMLKWAPAPFYHRSWVGVELSN